MKRTIIVCFAILLPVLIFLAAGTSQDNTLSKEDEKAIRTLIDEFVKSLVASDWNSLVEFYAEEAVQMPPNEPVTVGKESIRARLNGLKEMISFDHQDRPIKAIEGRDDLAFVWSAFRGRGKYNGEPFTNSGDILQVFRKQKDGTWKIVCDVWSYDLAEAGGIDSPF
jgi:ketosteroid isomerase-like protein